MLKILNSQKTTGTNKGKKDKNNGKEKGRKDRNWKTK